MLCFSIKQVIYMLKSTHDMILSAKTDSFPIPIPAIIAAAVIVALLVVFLVIYVFVIRKKKVRKEVRNLDRKFQFYHALLIGQDAQYVKRLEIISRTNLLYVEIHTKFLKRFKEIRDKHDATAQGTINHLMDFIDDKRYKQAKNYIPEVEEVINEYETLVNDLNNDLLQVVKPEEDCRQSSLNYKEQFRRIKQDYAAKQSDLILLAVSFEKVFEYIDSLFEQFEANVESAQYDEANAILPKIDGILHELTMNMVELPNLCVLVTDIIPTRIAELQKAHDQLKEQDYPLHHLCVETALRDMRHDLEVYKERIKKFDTKGIRDNLDNMLNRIEEFFKSFEDEKEARVIFEQENDSVYSSVNLIERRFIKLCNMIPEVSKIYIINEAHSSKINEIQTGVNKVGALKRSLDTFIHSNIKQPYSILVEKIDELREVSDSIISDLDEFNVYLASLKTDSEQAYKLVFTFFDKLKHAEKELRDINISRLKEKYDNAFNVSYEKLNNINDLLLRSPIDVDAVNVNVSELYEVSNDVLDGGAIAQDHNMMMLAESAIIYANKARSHLGDIDQIVAQAEAFFKEGDFEQAYVIAGNALRKVKANNEKQ